jgi:hypothetical protein
MQTAKNSNEWINWLEEAISKKYIKYYDYKHFNNIQKVGAGGFGKVQCARWKTSHKLFALKSFFEFDNNTVKEIVHEVVIIFIPVHMTR